MPKVTTRLEFGGTVPPIFKKWTAFISTANNMWKYVTRQGELFVLSGDCVTRLPRLFMKNLIYSEYKFRIR